MMNTWFPYIASLIILIFPYMGKFRYSLNVLQAVTISLGILGTFISITYSLIHFDPAHITENLPTLLIGLKTAVITVTAGISISLLLYLFPGLYGIRKEKRPIRLISGETTTPIMQEILNQLINLNKNLPKVGIAVNPDGSIRTGELFQDKALYDLTQQTSEIMHKQSHYLSITQEENRQLYEQLKQLLEATQTTNKNLEMLFKKILSKVIRKLQPKWMNSPNW